MRYVLIVLSLALFSCNQKKVIESKPDPMVKEMACDKGVVVILKKKDLDGCSWVFETNEFETNEVKYFIPINLNDFMDMESAEGEYKVKAEFRATKTATACMVGETVAITCMEILK